MTAPETTDAPAGHVVAVNGAQIVACLADADDAPPESPVRVGTLLRFGAGAGAVYGLVSELSVPYPAVDGPERGLRIAEVEVLGEIADGQRFRRGVTAPPSLGAPAYLAAPADVGLIYAVPDRETVRLGTIHQDPGIPANAIVDDLLGKHLAVLGTTGSGKSCAVALLLRRLTDSFTNSHILVLDPHDEYGAALGDRARTVHPDALELPHWLLTVDELLEVIRPGGAASAEEHAILADLVGQLRRERYDNSETARRITPDTPVPYQVYDLLQALDTAAGRLDRPDRAAPYQRLRRRLEALDRDPRFHFMFGPTSVQDDMAGILARLFRVPPDGCPLTIVDLSSMPSEVVSVVVSVVARLTFDLTMRSDGRLPVMLVCEEAHRYAPHDTTRGFEPTKKALARLAKEGRKYGASICVVSQRPSELAADLLAECNTLVALRMTSQRDQDFVTATIAESARGLMDFLPSLGNREALVIGEGVPVPMRITFDTLAEGERPRSETASYAQAWGGDAASGEIDLDAIVRRWRRLET